MGIESVKKCCGECEISDQNLIIFGSFWSKSVLEVVGDSHTPVYLRVLQVIRKEFVKSEAQKVKSEAQNV